MALIHGTTHRKSRTRRSPIGSPPGTLVADPHALKPEISVIAYGGEAIETNTVRDPAEVQAFLDRWPVTWANMVGLGDLGIVEGFGKLCDLHGLALEDAINTHQRAKFEDYDSFAFITVRMPIPGPRFETEQLSIFLRDRFLLTFQERHGDCFDPIRDRLQKSQTRIRGRSADYLAYALLDAVIDSYFPILEQYGEKVEDLEAALLQQADGSLITEIYELKRDLLNIRRAVWPLREMVNALLRDDTPLIAEETRIFMRDCYDHTVQLMDMVETYREIATSLVDLHMSTVSNRLNEVMKVLTIFATIFIPLGFVAGVYGMNFNPEKSPWNMPELSWYFGYPMALGLMAAIAGGLVYFFYRKGWIGSRQNSPQKWNRRARSGDSPRPVRRPPN